MFNWQIRVKCNFVNIQSSCFNGFVSQYIKFPEYLLSFLIFFTITRWPLLKFPPVLVIWGVWSTPLLPLLPGQLSPNVVALVKVPSTGRIDLFKNYSCSVWPYVKATTQKMWKWTYNQYDSLTSMHQITPYGLTYRYTLQPSKGETFDPLTEIRKRIRWT